MGSPWRHVVCDKCWEDMNPGKQAFRVTDAAPEKCCLCGGQAKGIYVREDPLKMACGGVH